MKTHIQTKMMLHQQYYQIKFNAKSRNRAKGGFRDQTEGVEMVDKKIPTASKVYPRIEK